MNTDEGQESYTTDEFGDVDVDHPSSPVPAAAAVVSDEPDVDSDEGSDEGTLDVSDSNDEY